MLPDIMDRDAQIKYAQGLSDEEIYQNALSDPDCPPLTAEELAEGVSVKDIPGDTLMEKFKNAREMKYKQLVSIRYDADILAYFRAKGRGYQTMMNDALRAFMEAEKASRQI